MVTAQYRGWSDYDDDELLAAAEGTFAVLLTLDTNLVYQQDVSSWEIGVVIIVVIIDVPPIVPSHLDRHMEKVRSALSIAAEDLGTVVVQEDGIDLLSA